MKNLHNEKGQFSIIAALLVSIVLVTAIITTYSIIRNNPLQERPQILGTIEEMNQGIDRILEFSVGYYCSILEVTGNTTYAKDLATEYLLNSLESMAYTHPHWSPTFQVTSSSLSTSWFNQTSYSSGALNITYSLIGLGIYEIKYAASTALNVIVNPSSTTHVLVNVARDDQDPLPSLGKSSFLFYRYNYDESTWKLDNSGLEINAITSTMIDSTYNITIPSSIDPSSYMLQVVDTRGIKVIASTYSKHIYDFSWNQTLFSELSYDTMAVEILQNGTLRSLGEYLQLATTPKPIPPIPVRGFRMNQTIDGIDREVPFQIEDWGSSYRVPNGLTSNVTIFNDRQMLVFLVNHNVDSVSLWWDGRDVANQTPYAFTNRYFTGDDPDSRILTNGILTLSFSSVGFTATSSLIGSSVVGTASFLRINNENPVYGASPAYVIHHGVVRDIVQQEAEWRGGIAGCPDVYGQIILTLPANATYYTYNTRLIFVDSLQSRTITDLSAIRLAVSTGQPLTENATSGGYPITTTQTGLFYNFTSVTGWAHHWSEFASENYGAGIMFTDSANQKLYTFDDIAGGNTGALYITSFGRVIEFNPVEITPVSFQFAYDISWQGAVVSFDETDPIYPTSGTAGLWAVVESPPLVSIS